MSKKNLVEISRKTVYQQKWQAKKECRSYHGADITEHQFLRNWTPHLPPIPEVPMQKAQDGESKDVSKYPPITALMFANLERRADFIVFRSHFASSIYQARQLVQQGRVKVNGVQVNLHSVSQVFPLITSDRSTNLDTPCKTWMLCQ
jgi:ribosomal protein S4